MEKHISGHTGKIEISTEKQARWIAKHNHFKKDMRPYKCTVGEKEHWHVTKMSKGRYYSNQRRDARTSERASDIAK